LTPKTGRFLLDTNVVIALLAGEGSVVSNLSRASEVFLPATVLGELFFGAANSARPTENAAKIERLAASSAIVACDLNVAREFGLVKQRLKQIGGPIPENDIWIAAAAICHSLVLVTRDRHFLQVERLSVTDWGPAVS
jgi:tRNA(fMet)-specific endonuclease VapC